MWWYHFSSLEELCHCCRGGSLTMNTNSHQGELLLCAPSPRTAAPAQAAKCSPWFGSNLTACAAAEEEGLLWTTFSLLGLAGQHSAPTLSGLYNSRSTFSHVRPFLSSFCENTHCLTLKQQRQAGEGQKLHISPLCTTQTRHYDRQSHAAFYILEDVVVWSRRSFRIVPSFVSTLMLLSEN